MPFPFINFLVKAGFFLACSKTIFVRGEKRSRRALLLLLSSMGERQKAALLVCGAVRSICVGLAGQICQHAHVEMFKR